MKNTLKRAVAILLAITILALANVPSNVFATAPTSTATATMSTFKDVKTTAWYYTYVNKLVELKITNGIGNNKYGPNNSVTRAEFVTLLCKAKGYVQTAGDPFVDTQKSWATGYITIALANGIMDLPKDKKFRPNDAITRLEAVEMMCRALNISKDTSFKNPYTDVKTNTGYTNAAFANYLMQGSVEKNVRYFKPSSKLTRGEVASVIVNAYDYNVDKMAYLNKKINADKAKAAAEKAEKDKYQAWLDTMDKGVSTELLKNTKYLNGCKNLFESYQKVMKEIYRGDYPAWLERSGASDYDEFVNMYVNIGKQALNARCNYDYRNIDTFKSNLNKYFSINYISYTIPDIIKNITSNKMIMEGNFYTGKGLVTGDGIGQPGLRGTLKYRYLSNLDLPKGKKLNTWYEDDILITFYVEPIGIKVSQWDELSTALGTIE